MTAAEIVEILTDRTTSYGFLSQLYRRELTLEALTSLAVNDAFHTQAENPGEGQKVLIDFFAGLAGQDLRQVQTDLSVDYAGLFLNASSRPVFPYESVYTSPEHLVMQQARDEVVREYESEGLGRSEGFNEPEDHISIELEFMGYLCQKATASLEREDRAAAVAYLQKQADFLEKHLWRWVPEFCEQVGAAARTDFYRGVALLTRDFLELDRQTIPALVGELG